MKIEYRVGNILDTDARYIAHCVNAQHKMASGVAKAIREAYPKAYNDYMAVDHLHLGQVICSLNEPHNILHIVGQQNYGYDGKQYVSYDAIRCGIATINNHLIGAEVAFPLIGCGLAGGNWDTMSQIIEQESTWCKPIVYTLDGKIP